MRLSIRALVVLALFAASWLAFAPRSARADDLPTLSGTWSASGMSASWNTKEWGDGCGEKPSGSGAPGGSVTIVQSGGELTISGAGSYTTSQCVQQMPGVSRISHSSGQRGWSTRCTSAAGDPRHVVIESGMSGNKEGTTLGFRETGVYEAFIQGNTCRATLSMSRSYTLVSRAGEAPAQTSATPSAAPPVTATATAKPAPTPTNPACGEPGPVVRFQISPSRKLMRSGGTFKLKSIAFDANGCVARAAPVFAIEGANAAKVSVDADGTVKVPDDAPEGEATIVGEIDDHKVRVIVEVVRADRYDSLLEERHLNAAGEDERAASVEIQSSVGGGATRNEDDARRRQQVFLGVIAALAVGLALIGFIVIRRGRGAAKRAPAEGAPDSEPVAAPNVTLFEKARPEDPMRCPTCDAYYPSGSAFCATDGSGLVPAPGVQLVDVPPPSSARPPSDVSRSASPKPKKPLPKICPTCGERFDGSAGFCGKDGTSLVPIN